MRSYLRERIRLYKASGAHNELMEVCAQMIGDAEIFDKICGGLDVRPCVSCVVV
jgi:hypothetical protein